MHHSDTTQAITQADHRTATEPHKGRADAMKSQFHFDDHEGFQKSALFLTTAGAGGALLGLFAQGVMLGSASMATEYTFGLAGLALGAAAGLLQERWSSVGLGAVVGLSMGLLVSALPALIGGAPVLGWMIGAALAGGLLGGLFGPERAPRPARAVAFALAGVLGMYVASVLVLSTSAPSWLTLPGIQPAAAGGILGLFLSLGGTVGRLRLDNDPVHLLWNEQRQSTRGDMAELAERGVELYDEIMTRLAKRRAEGGREPILEDTERVASETTQRVIRLAARWCSIEDSVDNTARPRLEARLDALQDKLAHVNDAVVRAEYTAATQSIRRQLSGFEKIEVARERLVARIHHCLTSLEQVSLTLLQLSTTDAQHASLSLQPELERLDEMSEEFSWQSLSVDDLCELSPNLGEPALEADTPAHEAASSQDSDDTPQASADTTTTLPEDDAIAANNDADDAPATSDANDAVEAAEVEAEVEVKAEAAATVSA